VSGPDALTAEQLREMRGLLATYATRLRLARALRDLRRDQLAAQSGISIESIATLERGHRHPFTREAQQLAEALDLPIAFFRATGISSEILCNVFSGVVDARARAIAEASP
jgi:transcriptional regulator with XRE-family HTH domain